MKSYSEAIKNAAKHYVYMDNSHCFSDAELFASHMAKAATIADIYDKDYDWVEFTLRRNEHIFSHTIGEWYDEYCRSIEDDEDTPETMLEDSSRYMED